MNRRATFIVLVVTTVAGVGLSRRSVAKADGQQATFSSKLEAIRVDALVTDRGEMIRGLQPGISRSGTMESGRPSIWSAFSSCR